MTKGIKNGMWAGGVAEYPNHYLMKQNRLIKLQKSKGLCEICSNPADRIHHKDGTKDNHSLNNLIVVCSHCHGIIHADVLGRPLGDKKSVFAKLYGINLRQLAEKFGGSMARYQLLHKKGKLKEFLTKQKNIGILIPMVQSTKNNTEK